MTASSEDKRSLARSLGAHAAVDVGAEDPAGALMEANGGERVDAVFEDLQARRTTGKLVLDPSR